ncbi:MAG TPA: polyphenol oxidase family protein [Acidimicrobiales bacterium]|nr:polyphenol oxidase family protein [Acidimicrobiales bacterium]
MRLGPARVRCTTRADGDQRNRPAFDDPAFDGPVPWTRLRQVHGAGVVVVEEPGGCSGQEADAAVTRVPGAHLAILTADCAPVALASAEGVIGAAHAGWKGLTAGVLERTADAMRALGATTIEAALGPCVHPGCYEFAAADLDAVAARLGDGVRGRTSAGAPALDLPAGVRAALDRAGVTLVYEDPACTACSADLYSWRARRDDARQAMVVWLPEATETAWMP